MSEFFHKISTKISNASGKASAFILSVMVVVIWAAVGPIFNYSDTWQLVINTSTTVITFLMVFLIQNTQNRDSKSIHLKLDELIRAQKNASNAFMDLDSRTDQELVELEEHFAIMSSKVTGEKLERQQKREANEHKLHIFNKSKKMGIDKDGDGVKDSAKK